jgi:hypothetical protein
MSQRVRLTETELVPFASPIRLHKRLKLCPGQPRVVESFQCQRKNLSAVRDYRFYA